MANHGLWQAPERRRLSSASICSRRARARSNKSQGQTLPFVGLYLPKPVFGHGQLYVGLSRVGDPSAIKVMVVDGGEQGRFDGRDGVWTVNIVYPEVLAEAR